MKDLSPREVALLAGRKTYIGQPCKNCGGCERGVANFGCLVCHRERVRARSRNRDANNGADERASMQQAAQARALLAGWQAGQGRGWLG